MVLFSNTWRVLAYHLLDPRQQSPSNGGSGLIDNGVAPIAGSFSHWSGTFLY
jgi:hypothetical protein